MEIIINTFSRIPIYEQIVEQMENEILSGKLKSGEALPSIRTLANDIRVSVITTKKVYEELERKGLILTVPQKGSFVSNISKEKLKEVIEKEIVRKANELFDYANNFGLSKSDVLKIIGGN